MSRELAVRRLGLVSYNEALTLQQRLVDERRAGAIPDTLLLLEHPPVITLGVKLASARANVVATPTALAARGVEVVETHLGWWRTPQQFRAEPSDQHGTIAVHGVPDLRGDLVVFRLRRGDAHWIAGPARLLGDGGSHVLDARPGQYRAPVGEVPRCGRNSRDPRPGSSALQGRVVRRDGVRADRVGLELSGNGPTMCGWDDARWERNVRTDAEGAFSIPELPEGAIEIVVNEIGMVQIRREVTLGAGEVLALELREPEGRSVTVHIVDPRGEPLPFAALEIDQEDGPEYALVEDGVQTLGILTGPDGVRALPDLSHVPVAVTARFGSRSATGRAGVDDESIEIVVPDATAED